MRFRIPKQVSILITVMQISQMVVGFYGMLYSFNQSLDPRGQCDATPANAAFGVGVYLLFLILFVNFFVRSYLFCSAPPAGDREAKKQL